MPEDPEAPIPVMQPAVTAAWNNLRSLLESDGWRFRDVVTGEGVFKFGGRVTLDHDAASIVRDFMIGDHGLRKVFSKTVEELKAGIVLVRLAPHVVGHDLDPPVFGLIRARFGWLPA